MSNSKTPLELINDINKHCLELFELKRVSKALLETASMENAEIAKTIVRALANTCAELASHVTDIYWDASDLKRILEDNLLDETKELEEDLPFVTPSDKKEEVEA